jgi:hypothetical protein
MVAAQVDRRHRHRDQPGAGEASVPADSQHRPSTSEIVPSDCDEQRSSPPEKAPVSRSM